MNLDFSKVAGVAAAPFTGGASLALMAASTAADAYFANRAQQASRGMAREQMEFQKYMAGTAHQREVADLRKAGLNPILSGTGGAGASTPGGASGTAFQPNVSQGISSGLAAARQMKMLHKEYELLNQKTNQQYADARRAQTEEEISRQVFAHNREMMPALEASARAAAARDLYSAQREGIQYGVESARAPIEYDRARMEDSPGGRWKRRIDYYGETVGNVLGMGAKVAGTLSAAQVAQAVRAWKSSQAARGKSSGKARPFIRGLGREPVLVPRPW